MAIAVTVAGTPKAIQVNSLRISRTANGRSTASLAIKSLDATYRPALDAEIIIEENAVRIFGGLLDRPRERGLADGSSVGIVTSFDASDFNSYADRVHVNGSIPAGTLLDTLNFLYTGYLIGYGVTVDLLQVNGPSLPQLDFTYTRVSDVLNTVATMTADLGEPYVWRIDDFKVISMYQPSTVPAPFDLNAEAIPEVMGDIEVESTRDHYANQVIVTMAPKTEMNRVETFTGDGTTDAFQLQYIPFATRGYVVTDFATNYFETLSDPGGGGTWELDTVTNQLTRVTGAPAVGADIRMTFDGTFQGLGQATDFAEVAAVGLWQRVYTVDAIPSDTTAQLLAEAYLARALPVTQVIRYRTRVPGVAPGQTQAVIIARRNLSATATITDVVIRDMIQGGTNILVRDVTAVCDAGQTNLGRGFRDDYKIWYGDRAGASAAAPVTAGTGAPGGAPGLPFTSVQFNRSGVFGGDADFTFNEITNSLVVGGGGSSITAAEHESCLVQGYNCHIADP